MKKIFLPLGLYAVTVSIIYADCAALKFDGGGSLDAPVVNAVDSFTGKVGEGWGTGWKTAVNKSVISASVVSEKPLSAGGNYLKVNVKATEATSPCGSVGRGVDTPVSVDLTKPYTVSFEVRVDSALSKDQFCSIYMTPSVTPTTSGDATWIIRGSSSGGWRLVDGSKDGKVIKEAQTIPLASGTVYKFVVNVDPASQTWTVAIQYGGESFTSQPMGFRAPELKGGRGMLCFSGQVANVNEEVSFSVDSISVTAKK